MAQTIYDILTNDPYELSCHTQGRRIAYINNYHWAVISRFSGTYLYRSSDLGVTWILKGTILAHTSTLTVFSLHIHAIPSSNLFYWSAHVYKTGSIHNIYVGQVDLTDPDNPVIGSATNVSDQTTTTGCYYAQITLTGAGSFYLSYMTTRAGGSPYHQYYTLMSNNYTNWAGCVELNIANSSTAVGRIVIERRRSLNGVCIVYYSGTNAKYRYNSVGNSNLNGDWTVESNVSAVTVAQPSTSTWLQRKLLSIASTSDGKIACTVTTTTTSYVYYTDTFVGVWTAVISGGSSTYLNTSITIVDNGDIPYDVIAYLLNYTNVSYIYVQPFVVGASYSNQSQIGTTDDIIYFVSSPEYVPLFIKYAVPLFSEKSVGMSVLSGIWTSDIKNVTGVTSWGNLTLQNELFPDSSHGIGQTYYIETRTGNTSPPAGAWTGVTQLGPTTYQVNSALGNYIQIRISYSTDPTLYDSLIPLTSVDDISPLPITLNYTVPSSRALMGITWYMRYGVSRY